MHHHQTGFGFSELQGLGQKENSPCLIIFVRVKPDQLMGMSFGSCHCREEKRLSCPMTFQMMFRDLFNVGFVPFLPLDLCIKKRLPNLENNEAFSIRLG